MRRAKKLTPEQKKLIWAEPESNAGAGWVSQSDQRDYSRPVDGMAIEYGTGAGSRRVTNARLRRR